MRVSISMLAGAVAVAGACDADAPPQLIPCDSSPASTGACASNVQYSSVSSGLRLDVYTPAGGTRGYPVVLIHGGGWKRGDKAGYGDPARDLSAAGLTVFAIDYRLHGTCDADVPNPGSTDSGLLLDDGSGCTTPTTVDTTSHAWTTPSAPMIEDVAAALDWVASHGREYYAAYDPADGKTHTIGVVGFSAGGQLALMSALHPIVTTRPIAVAALSPPADFEWCGTTHTFTARDGDVGTTGPGGNTCGYDAAVSAFGDYPNDPAAVTNWRDASAVWRLQNGATTPASFWIVNGTGATTTGGEFIPGVESHTFATVLRAIDPTADVTQVLSAVDRHAEANWGETLYGDPSRVVKTEISSFLLDRLAADAAVTHDEVDAP